MWNAYWARASHLHGRGVICSVYPGGIDTVTFSGKNTGPYKAACVHLTSEIPTAILKGKGNACTWLAEVNIPEL